ncbi:MAG: type II toxin-antitoxin system PemK/MazF family toxin [Dehalococcoidia bacterium]
MATQPPRRGEVWLVAFDPAPPAQGHEQAGPRPALITSVDLFNAGPSDLVVVLPITRTSRNNPLHVRLSPPEGRVRAPSWVPCDQVTVVSHLRLRYRIGAVSPATMQAVGIRLRTILGI